MCFLVLFIKYSLNSFKCSAFLSVTEVDDNLEDGASYVFGMQAVTNDGNNVVTSFSEEIKTLPVDAVPGK